MKNFKSSASAAKQQGFSLLTGFILVIIMFGALAFFLAGSGISTSVGAGYANNSKVSSLLASASNISTGFDQVVLTGTSPASATFDTAVTTGMFNPDTGGSATQSVDPSLIVTRTVASTIDGYWVYRTNDVQMLGVGDAGGTAVADYTVAVSGIKKGICQQINTTLHGTLITATPPSSGLADAVLIGAPTAAAPAVTGTAAVMAGASPTGWTSGCYSTSDVTVGTELNYVFVHTIMAQ